MLSWRLNQEWRRIGADTVGETTASLVSSERKIIFTSSSNDHFEGEVDALGASTYYVTQFFEIFDPSPIVINFTK